MAPLQAAGTGEQTIVDLDDNHFDDTLGDVLDDDANAASTNNAAAAAVAITVTTLAVAFVVVAFASALLPSLSPSLLSP